MGWLSKTFIGLGIAVAFLLVFGAVVAFTAYNESKPYIEREYPTVLVDQTRTCSPCTEVGAAESFTVTSSMNKVRGDIQIVLEAGSGSIQIVVRDPSGDIRYDRTFSGGTSAQTLRDSPSWTAEEGGWTLTRAYTLTRGVIDITLWGEGLPPGSL